MYERIAAELGVTPMTVGTWRKRFARARCAGLVEGPRSGRPKPELVLTDAEREQLTWWARRARTAQALAPRARTVLACAEGLANAEVAARLRVTPGTVNRWRARLSPAAVSMFHRLGRPAVGASGRVLLRLSTALLPGFERPKLTGGGLRRVTLEDAVCTAAKYSRTAADRCQPVRDCNGSPRSGWLVALEAKVRRTAGKCSNIISCCRILRAAFTLYAQQPVPRKSARAYESRLKTHTSWRFGSRESARAGALTHRPGP